MKKVHAKATLSLVIPVTVEVDLFIKADEGASIGKVVEKWAAGKPFSNADVEDCCILRIAEVNGYDPGDLDFATDVLGNHKAKVLSCVVIDSR